MAISGASSFIPTTDEFVAHWERANEAFGGAGGITVANGVGVARLVELRDLLEAKRVELIGALNQVEFSSADIKIAKRTLVERFGQFSGQVRALYGGSVWEAALPVAPSSTLAESKFMRPMIEAANVWARLETAGGSILLAGNFGLGDFQAAIDVLAEAYRAWTVAGSNARLARAERNALQSEIYPILKQYRGVVPSLFPPKSVFVDTLPRLTPLPGHTPAPVEASASWDAGRGEARVAWTASGDARLKEYQVRYVPGDRYDGDDEAVVATVGRNGEREIWTDAGLGRVGAQASFKVYVVLATGNERGSEPVVVERPDT